MDKVTELWPNLFADMWPDNERKILIYQTSLSLKEVHKPCDCPPWNNVLQAAYADQGKIWVGPVGFDISLCGDIEWLKFKEATINPELDYWMYYDGFKRNNKETASEDDQHG